MLFYADRISDNIRKREPEGYLICVNVPIARSGTQQYLQDEIGQRGEKAVTVYRPEEEVFSPATMASFEGMPVTNDHPDNEDGVNAENSQYLAKGHCQNVRRGTGKDKDLLIADLVIMDPGTIEDIMNGKREISCGYNYELSEEDGKLVQRQIRGNHIAIVDKGRAGHRVCIKDSAPTIERRKSRMRKNFNGILAKMLASFARDAEPDEIEEAVEAIDEITTEPNIVPPDPEQGEDAEPDKMDMILDKLDQIIGSKDCGGKDEEPEEEDPMQKLEDDLDKIEEATKVAEELENGDEEPMEPEEDPDEPESHFVDPEAINEEDEDPEEVIVEEEEKEGIPVSDKRACDAARVALKVIRPIIAKLPPSERKKAADAAVRQIRKASGMDAMARKNGYVALKRSKKSSFDSAANEADLGRRIMASRNPNYEK